MLGISETLEVNLARKPHHTDHSFMATETREEAFGFDAFDIVWQREISTTYNWGLGC